MRRLNAPIFIVAGLCFDVDYEDPGRDHFALRPQKRGGLLGTGTGGMGRKSEGSTADTARKRPERPWTAARTMEVLRRCPLAIAQRLVHYRAWAESQGLCPLHCSWETTRSERSPTFAAQLHLPTHDLFWANLKVQLHLPPLDLLIFWSRLEPCNMIQVSCWSLLYSASLRSRAHSPRSCHMWFYK